MNSLIDKYNKAIPRYTSYPPVPNWKDNVNNQTQWLNIFKSDMLNDSDEGISVYIHLPFCEQLCTYCGCNKRITKRHELEVPYIKALKAEWDIYLNHFEKPPHVKYIHLGGGTPTFFEASHLKDLLTHILNNCSLANDYQFSFEGHPNNTKFDHLAVLRTLGFRRVSYGIQDFGEKVQFAINRIQPVENVEKVVKWSRALGYTSINFDLVYGLPFQSISSIEFTIEKVAEFKPERIALYSYAHVPWVAKSQRGYDESNLPSPEVKQSFYVYAKEALIKMGYEAIGMDHFALVNDELSIAKRSANLHRNFMGYTTDSANQMIGLGCSSISSSKHAFVQNKKNVEAYQNSVLKGELPIIKSHSLNKKETQISKIISSLICNGFFDFSVNDILESYFDNAAEELEVLASDELLQINNKSIEVTEKGMLYVRNICALFDVYQKEDSVDRMFSQSV